MKLKAWLKKNKITQATFAKLVGTAQPHISDLVTGKVIPMLELAAKIKCKTRGAVAFADWTNPEKR